MPNFSVKKISLVLGLAIIVILFFALDLNHYMKLSYLKESRASFQALYQAHPSAVLGTYFAIYILVVALNLPGAAVMTLAGGALFGFWAGLVVVSFASSIGATLACFLARYLFQDWVQTKFNRRLNKVNQGIEQEGSFYLFTLRLIPVIPFFAINLILGLTRMPLWRFYWVSQVGMLPGTAVYVNAGKELGQITALGDILSPSLIISFVILGLFPLTAKKLINLYRRKAGMDTVDSNSLPEGNKETHHDNI